MPEYRREYNRFRQRFKKEKDWPGLICMRCGHFEKGGHLHHVVPLHAGGDPGEENIVPLCHCCHEDIERFGHRRVSMAEFVSIPDQHALEIGIRAGLFDSDMAARDVFPFLLRIEREMASMRYAEKRQEDWPEYWELWEDERKTFPRMAEVV